MTPQIFRTPKRRLTRQRSGYHVAGEKTGSEAVITNAQIFSVSSNFLKVVFARKNNVCEPQFNSNNGIVAIGGYIKSEKPINLKVALEIKNTKNGEKISTVNQNFTISSSKWQAFGLHLDIENASKNIKIDVLAEILLTTTEKKIGDVQFFGFNFGAVNAYSDQETREHFDTKTGIYIPGIYYFIEDKPFSMQPVKTEGVTSTSKGEQIVLKACNRCSRYLIIDILDERNSLGFSNHCVTRAPCQHNAFSKYKIQNKIEIEERLVKAGVITNSGYDYFVEANYGFQLECRSCKKFKVNAPLNPMRNETQHREDGLRRRAFEQLVLHLLGADWVFFEHRQQYGREFDVFIWEKFGKRCFGCGKKVESLDEMNLDHTLPLNYLYPLDDTATCLCKTCNSQKNNKFPYEFEKYQSKGKLKQLSEITAIPYDVLSEKNRKVNQIAVDRLRERIQWFFDEFLMNPDYQKDRQGKKAADLIVASLQRVFNSTGVGWNLLDEYTSKTGSAPKSVSIDMVVEETESMTEPEIDV